MRLTALLRWFEVGCLAIAFVAISGCGGGGSGDQRDLSVNFVYRDGAQTDLYSTPPPPTLEGLNGVTPNCTLLSGSTLPSGVSLGSDCFFHGTSTSTGDFRGNVRLIASGYKGELTSSYSFSVNALVFRPAAPIGPTAYKFGLPLGGTRDSSPIAQLDYYHPQTGDQTALAVFSGALPAGVSVTVDDAGTVIAHGTPSAVGESDVTLSFTLQRAGHTTSVKVDLSFQITVDAPGFYYYPCCSSSIGIPASFSPTINYDAVQGVVITYDVSSGSLPAGLQLDPATGEIRGTPTTGEASGYFGVTITATATANGVVGSQANTQLTIMPTGVFGTYPVSSLGTSVIYFSGAFPPFSVDYEVPSGVAFTVAPGPIFGGTAGDTYRFRLVPNRFTVTPVPGWVSIDATTGVISATRPAEGVYAQFEVEVTLGRGGNSYVVNQFWTIQ